MEDKTSYTYWRSCLDEIFIDTMQMVHRGKDIEQAAKEAFGYLVCDPERLNRSEPADFRRLVNGWLANKRFPKQEPNKRVDLTSI